MIFIECLLYRDDEEEVMELLWQNGQVVAHSQSQRSHRKSHTNGAAGPLEIRSGDETVVNATESAAAANQLFIHEDEMASWLHYPLEDYNSFDRDFYADLLCTNPVASAAAGAVTPPPRQAAPVAVAPKPPVPPPKKRTEPAFVEPTQSVRHQNFSFLSRPKGKKVIESVPSSSNKESTVVDSTDTPFTTALESRVSEANIGCSFTNTNTNTNTNTSLCELTVSSSPGGSGASVSGASIEPIHKLTNSTAVVAALAPEDDRKRKGREADDSECQSEVSILDNCSMYLVHLVTL